VNTNSNLKILIAASGTGGHLFPALHLANSFKKLDNRINIEFIGSGRPLEGKILGQTGLPINVISMVGVKHRGVLGFVKFLFLLPAAVIATCKLVKRFKPNIIVGVGGYVSVLPVLIAYFLRIPTWIHEAEIQPGMANAFLKYFATRVSVAFSNATLLGPSKVLFTGHPVRDEMKNVSIGISEEERPKRILLLGGSQGAKALDQAMSQLSSQLAKMDIELWHQCREENVQELLLAYKQSGLNARVNAFIENMIEAYSWCDVLIARSGAGTVMEASVINRPIIFVPYPSAQGDHQTANALTLVNAGKALLVKEGEDFSTKLLDAIDNILDKEFYHNMRKMPYEPRSLKAADLIAKGCIDLAQQ
jgi:UDP-N-acetylglucosamine--N-acetylmuramyl-(pentapeptide) pyrophosphoryl-undecaprenol N-acetylglucosamine transferase